MPFWSALFLKIAIDAVQAERIGFVLRLLFYRSMSMSKYEPLWGWVGKQPAKNFTLTFAEIQQILGFPIVLKTLLTMETFLIIV